MSNSITDPHPKYDDDQRVMAALRAPFTQEDLGFVTFKTNDDGGWAIVAPYVDARAVRRRLNRVVGSPNWTNELESVGVKGEGFISRMAVTLPSGAVLQGEEAAGMTDVEPIKGGASQALRRVAMAVAGIGEYLYGIEEDLFVDYDKSEYPPYSNQEAYNEMPDWAKLLPSGSQEALTDHAAGMGVGEEELNVLLYESELPASSVDEVAISDKRRVFEMLNAAENGQAA